MNLSGLGTRLPEWLPILLWGGSRSNHRIIYSLLQQPGPKKFKLSKIDLLYKAKKFKVPRCTIYVYPATLFQVERAL